MTTINNYINRIVEINGVYYAPNEAMGEVRQWDVEYSPTIYKSIDSINWEEISFPDMDNYDELKLTHIAGDENGILIIGYYYDNNYGDYRIIGFKSTDGETFEILPNFTENYHEITSDLNISGFRLRQSGEYIIEGADFYAVDSSGNVSLYDTPMNRYTTYDTAVVFKYGEYYFEVTRDKVYRSSDAIGKREYYGNSPAFGQWGRQVLSLNGDIIYLTKETNNSDVIISVTKDGVNVIRSGIIASPPSALNIRRMWYANETYFIAEDAYASNAPMIIHYSNDLNNWTKLQTNIPTRSSTQNLYANYINGKWLLANQYGTVYWNNTLTATGWETVPYLDEVSETGLPKSSVYGLIPDSIESPTFLLALSDHQNYRDKIYKSTDGINWTSYDRGTNVRSSIGLEKIGDRYVTSVATPQETEISYSTDGENWTTEKLEGYRGNIISSLLVNNSTFFEVIGRVLLVEQRVGYGSVGRNAITSLSYTDQWNEIGDLFFLEITHSTEKKNLSHIDFTPYTIISSWSSDDGNKWHAFAVSDDLGNTWEGFKYNIPESEGILSTISGGKAKIIGNNLIHVIMVIEYLQQTNEERLKIVFNVYNDWPNNLLPDETVSYLYDAPVYGIKDFGFNGNGWIIISGEDGESYNSILFSKDRNNWRLKIIHEVDTLSPWKEVEYSYIPSQRVRGELTRVAYCGDIMAYTRYQEDYTEPFKNVKIVINSENVMTKTLEDGIVRTDLYVNSTNAEARFLDIIDDNIEFVRTEDFVTVNIKNITIPNYNEDNTEISCKSISDDGIIILTYKDGTIVFINSNSENELYRFNIDDLNVPEFNGAYPIKALYAGNSVWNIFIGISGSSGDEIYGRITVNNYNNVINNPFPEVTELVKFIENPNVESTSRRAAILMMSDWGTFSQFLDTKDGWETWERVDVDDIFNSVGFWGGAYDMQVLPNGTLAVTLDNEYEWPITYHLAINPINYETNDWEVSNSFPLNLPENSYKDYGEDFICGTESGHVFTSTRYHKDYGEEERQFYVNISTLHSPEETNLFPPYDENYPYLPLDKYNIGSGYQNVSNNPAQLITNTVDKKALIFVRERLTGQE